MFTGIVSGVGTVTAVERARAGIRVKILPPARYRRFRSGESVCVAGVCLTAVRAGRELVADLSPETLRRSTLSGLEVGSRLNLERALRWGDRLSGHFVMGHVDAVARLLSVSRTGNSWMFRFSIPRNLGRFVVPKGSVALDGVSLTVARRKGAGFEVAVIPETFRRTTFGSRARGDRVNFEVDVFARYGRAGAVRRVRPRKPRP